FGSGDWSISFLYSTTNGTAHRMIDKNTDTAYGVLFSAADNILARADDGSNAAQANYTDSVTTNGDWHHIVFQRDGTTVRLYFNGTEVNSGTDASLGSLANAVDLVIGSTGTLPPSQVFNGTIDEVRVYTDVLTATEVEELFNNSQNLNLLFGDEEIGSPDNVAPTFDEDTINGTNIYHGWEWELDINCSDSDGDILEYTVNSTLISIDNDTGAINMTAAPESIGNYTNIGVFCNDTEDEVEQVFDIEIINDAPTLTTPVLEPTIAFSGETINCSVGINSTDTDLSNITFTLYINGLFASSDYQHIENNTANDTIITANITAPAAKGDTVLCEVRADDSWDNTSANTSEITILNSPPTFDEDTINFTESHTIAWNYDINCTDKDGDIISYEVNTTLIDIDNDTGEINITANLDNIGNFTDWGVFCNDTDNESEQVFDADINNLLPTHSLPWIGAAYNYTNDTQSYLSDYLVSYWQFDGHANDTMELIDFTVVGALLNDTGKLGEAYEFEGDDDYLYNPASNFRSTDNEGTISAWIKLRTVGASQAILTSSDEAVVNRYLLFFVTNTNKISMDTQISGTDTSVFGSTALNVNQWYHVTTTCNGTTWKLYVNGLEESLTGTNTGNWFADVEGRDNVVIGVLNYSAGVALDFNGTIDEVMIFNRSLSSDEVGLLYNQSIGVHAKTDNDLYFTVNNSADYENQTLKTIVGQIYEDGNPTIVLNMPFERNGTNNANHTEDYSGFANYGDDLTTNDFLGSGWNATGGYDGWGAYEFDGLNDYLDLGVVSGLDSEMGGIKTISVWVNPSQDRDQYILSNIHSGSPGGFFILHFGSINRVDIGWDGGTNRISTAEDLPLNTWTNVVAVFNGASSKIYYNGIQKASGDIKTEDTESNKLRISGRWVTADSGSSSLFNGTIDEVLIFNRSLTAAEISALYQNQSYKYSMYETSKNHNYSADIYVHDGFEPSVFQPSDNISVENTAPNFDQDLINVIENHNTEWTFDVNCSDTDGDTISYLVNSTKIDINSGTGIINFTFNLTDIGNFTDLGVFCNDT
ncbi:LamG domain-containing protein, partial [Candidatus Woesearchaeota archaeon]|nr:LamG domain-containing protein [Candidatus Woesearchaeota archaeon]